MIKKLLENLKKNDNQTFNYIGTAGDFQEKDKEVTKTIDTPLMSR